MQNNRIQKLSALLINQIAAGEVVTRPASVVKELIENAIDAQATQIRIDIEQGGLGLIQVTDNGHGIHPDDMTLAITRHATSKLADVAQLMGINSLGFRGEALASIAAVSHLTLTSSHDDTGIGQQLTVSGSEVSQATLRPIVKQRGTTVTVRDLYYNVPARRANLKSIATEFSHIEQIVQRLAISFADVTILLYHQDKPRLQLGHSLPAAPSATSQPDVLLTRLEQALNLPLTSMAVPFFLSLEGLLDSRAQQTLPHLSPQVHGWLFVHHTINLPKLIYINQRLVTDFTIGQALQKVARQLGLGQAGAAHLGYALFFVLPSAWVNVNIHPSKQQVKIQPLSNILAWLSQHVYQQLQPRVGQITVMVDDTSDNTSANTSINRKVPKASSSQQGASLAGVATVATNLAATNTAARANLKSHPHNHSLAQQVNAPALDYQLSSSVLNTSVPANTVLQPPLQVLGISQQAAQHYALVFWQNEFYVLPLADLALPALTVDIVQHHLNQSDANAQLANQHGISQDRLVQWLLSSKNF